MLALAARHMGARVVCVGRDGANSPAAPVCDDALAWNEDPAALVAELSRRTDVVTFEFESVPADLLDALGASAIECRPSPGVVTVAADRTREKALFVATDVPTVAHQGVKGRDEAVDAVLSAGGPVVVKTASGGYDGHGQVVVGAAVSPDEALAAVTALDVDHLIVEELVEMAAEWSVVVCRDSTGGVAYEPFENLHVDHVLDTSTWPARDPGDLAPSVVDHSLRLAEAVDLVGVMCIEWFVTADGRALANEIAPRPHNSAHLTIEAAATSQFAQQARIALGFPLGAVGRRSPAAMANLLGDLWRSGAPPDFVAALSAGDVHLHHYGKSEARPGRKMGHLTALADDPREALHSVRAARSALRRRR
jgi:5-(carboxyamino)imidazole ribonucleotide synthase